MKRMLIIIVNIYLTIIAIYDLIGNYMFNDMIIPSIIVLLINLYLSYKAIKKRDLLLELIIIMIYWQLSLTLNDYNYYMLLIDEHLIFYTITFLIFYYLIKKELYKKVFYKCLLILITVFLIYSTATPIGAVQLDIALLVNPIEAYTTTYSIREKKSDAYVFYYPNKNIGMIDTEFKIKVKKVIIFYIAEFYGF
jgi:hypothetical protein